MITTFAKRINLEGAQFGLLESYVDGQVQGIARMYSIDILYIIHFVVGQRLKFENSFAL